MGTNIPENSFLKLTTSYTVEKGNTLGQIVNDNGGSINIWDEVANDNGIKNKDLIYENQEIVFTTSMLKNQYENIDSSLLQDEENMQIFQESLQDAYTFYEEKAKENANFQDEFEYIASLSEEYGVFEDEDIEEGSEEETPKETEAAPAQTPSETPSEMQNAPADTSNPQETNQNTVSGALQVGLNAAVAVGQAALEAAKAVNGAQPENTAQTPDKTETQTETQTYSVDNPDVQNFMGAKGIQSNEFIEKCADAYGMSPEDTQKLINERNKITLAWYEQEKANNESALSPSYELVLNKDNEKAYNDLLKATAQPYIDFLSSMIPQPNTDYSCYDWNKALENANEEFNNSLASSKEAVDNKMKEFDEQIDSIPNLRKAMNLYDTALQNDIKVDRNIKKFIENHEVKKGIDITSYLENLEIKIANQNTNL